MITETLIMTSYASIEEYQLQQKKEVRLPNALNTYKKYERGKQVPKRKTSTEKGILYTLIDYIH